MAVTFNANSTPFHKIPVTATNDSTGLTIAAGTDRALVVQITMSAQGNSVTSVVWGQGTANESCALIGTAQASPTVGECWLYGLVNPSTGNLTLRVNVTGTDEEIFIHATAFDGVDQADESTSFTNFVSSTGNGTAPGRAVTSATDDMTLALVSGPQLIDTTNFNELAAYNDGNATGYASSYQAGSASNNHTFSLAGAVDWVALGVNIVAATGGGGDPSILPLVACDMADMADMKDMRG